MKKIALTLIAVAGISAGALAQGTITADNLNGTGGPTATSFGLFFNNDGSVYTGSSINMTLLGGADAGSLAELITLTGANGPISFGGGVYVDPTAGTYTINSVAPQADAVLQVLAWVGSAATYGAAAQADQFWAYNGSTYVSADTFTFTNPTGGTGAPPKIPQSLDGMPAMMMVVPEPATIALAGLGLASLLAFRRRRN